MKARDRRAGKGHTDQDATNQAREDNNSINDVSYSVHPVSNPVSTKYDWLLDSGNHISYLYHTRSIH